MSDEQQDDIDRIILEDEEGNELPCVVLSVAEIDGQDYALVAPAESYDDESNDTLELLIFKYDEDEVDGAALFSEVDSDEAYENAKQFFASLMQDDVEEVEE